MGLVNVFWDVFFPKQSSSLPVARVLPEEKMFVPIQGRRLALDETELPATQTLLPRNTSLDEAVGERVGAKRPSSSALYCHSFLVHFPQRFALPCATWRLHQHRGSWRALAARPNGRHCGGQCRDRLRLWRVLNNIITSLNVNMHFLYCCSLCAIFGPGIACAIRRISGILFRLKI